MWRPIQLDQVVGQKHITDTLKQASKNKEFVHAYLLSGNHGSGKTSTARILATLMTCENVKDGVVCGECRACKTIHKGASLDVKELDGATHRGIDDVKVLIDSAQWGPSELSRKVYIIDEFHQLTKEATSALLKILEEPPSYLSFILCTTEIQKILPTILSRCQRFNFGKISSKEISCRLTEIAQKEQILIEQDAIYHLARMSRGSMRDAIGSLEQIGTLANSRNITAKIVRGYFGMSDKSAINGIVKSILDAKIPVLLDQINDLAMASVDARQIMLEISETFRNIMLLKVQNEHSNLVDLPDVEIATLKEFGKSLKLQQLIKLAQIFSDIEKKMSFNINERWIMEATLINCIATLRKNNQ